MVSSLNNNKQFLENVNKIAFDFFFLALGLFLLMVIYNFYFSDKTEARQSLVSEEIGSKEFYLSKKYIGLSMVLKEFIIRPLNSFDSKSEEKEIASKLKDFSESNYEYVRLKQFSIANELLTVNNTLNNLNYLKQNEVQITPKPPTPPKVSFKYKENGEIFIDDSSNPSLKTATNIKSILKKTSINTSYASYLSELEKLSLNKELQLELSNRNQTQIKQLIHPNTNLYISPSTSTSSNQQDQIKEPKDNNETDSKSKYRAINNYSSEEEEERLKLI